MRRTRERSMEGFGAALRSARLGRLNAHGRPWSQYDLAEYLGVRASSVSRIESGESRPGGETLLLILELFPELREIARPDMTHQVAELIEWLPRAHPDLQELVLEAYRNARSIERENNASS